MVVVLVVVVAVVMVVGIRKAFILMLQMNSNTILRFILIVGMVGIQIIMVNDGIFECFVLVFVLVLVLYGWMTDDDPLYFIDLMALVCSCV